MVGPPGAGKTMLARRLPGILPPPDFDEALEITRVHSVAGLGRGRPRARAAVPRAPPHDLAAGPRRRRRAGRARARSRSPTAACSSSTSWRSSRGAALEALRQPLEEGQVEIVRGQRSVAFPARVDARRAPATRARARGRAAACRCGELDRARYQRRLSGPLLDRIDLVCQVTPPPARDLVARDPARGSVRRRPGAGGRRARAPAAAAARHAARLQRRDGRRGSRAATCRSGKGSRRRLIRSREPGALSGRGHDRVLRLARTIADLAGRERVTAPTTSTRRSATGSCRRSWRRMRRRHVSSACDRCLRRGMLIGLLARADRGPAGRAPGATRRRCWRWTTSGWSRRSPVPGSAARPSAFLAELRRRTARARRVAAAGVDAVCRHSIAYPDRLLQLNDPPAVLFTRGQTAGASPRSHTARRRDRRQPQGLAARARDGARSWAAGWPRPASRWSAGWRSVSTPAPTWARWKARAARSRCSAPGPTSSIRVPTRGSTSGSPPGAADLRAAARPAPVSLELPGAQPDHGRRFARRQSWSRPRSSRDR